jgi:hypothetical protein
MGDGQYVRVGTQHHLAPKARALHQLWYPPRSEGGEKNPGRRQRPGLAFGQAPEGTLQLRAELPSHKSAVVVQPPPEANGPSSPKLLSDEAIARDAGRGSGSAVPASEDKSIASPAGSRHGASTVESTINVTSKKTEGVEPTARGRELTGGVGPGERRKG